MGDKTNLGMGLVSRLIFEVVLADLKSLQVIPLGVGIDDVLFQLDVGGGGVRVVCVLNITVGKNNKAACPPGCPTRRMASVDKGVACTSGD